MVMPPQTALRLCRDVVGRKAGLSLMVVIMNDTPWGIREDEQEVLRERETTVAEIFKI